MCFGEPPTNLRCETRRTDCVGERDPPTFCPLWDQSGESACVGDRGFVRPFCRQVNRTTTFGLYFHRSISRNDLHAISRERDDTTFDLMGNSLAGTLLLLVLNGSGYPVAPGGFTTIASLPTMTPRLPQFAATVAGVPNCCATVPARDDHARHTRRLLSDRRRPSRLVLHHLWDTREYHHWRCCPRYCSLGAPEESDEDRDLCVP